MLILILAILIIAFVAFLILRVKYPYVPRYDFGVHQFFTLMACLCGVLIAFLLVAICKTSIDIASEPAIDAKIVMYQEENKKIEQDIDRIVQEYLEHEQDTFSGLKPEDSSITLITLFPELKSDSLVQKQLEIYTKNNAQIKELKEEKINLSTTKWILYFGR